MAILRPNKPPLPAKLDDFVWKKWFSDLYDLTKSGVVSPSPLTYPTNGVQGHLVPKNVVINGDFQVWQRGTSFTVGAVNSVYSADRWTGSRGGIVGMTMSRQTGPSGIPYCLRATRAVADVGTNDQTICYNVPTLDAIAFAGQQLTCSFWMRIGSGFATGSRMEVRILSGTGTDENRLNGAYTGAFPINQTYVAACNTTWQRFSFNFTLASTVTEFCALFSQRGITAAAAAANDYFEMTGIQIEAGGVASPFQFEPFAQTVLRCQRFFQKSFPYAVTPAQNTANNLGAFQHTVTTAGAAASYSGVLSFSPTMHRTPTMTFYNPNAANAFTWNYNTTTSGTATAASGITNEKFLALQTTGVAGWAVGQLLAIHWTADSEL